MQGVALLFSFRMAGTFRDGGAKSMKISRRRTIAALAGVSVAAAARPSEAVVILDSTWKAEGGRPGRESAGFGAHIALANQPQFNSLVAFSSDDGESWGQASGTWIGNVDGRACILTAAHNFDDGVKAHGYLYRVGGNVHRGSAKTLHPLYNGDLERRTGYDFAIVTLERAVNNVGQAPTLSARQLAVGQPIVMIGYGSRGIASIGQRPEFHEGADKAAAENTIDEVQPPITPAPRDSDAGNWFGVTMRRENEGATRLEGILGSGDSGGSVWMRTGAGWAIVGVNSNGTGDDNATYGHSSTFAAVAGVHQWIREMVPGVRFTG